MSQSTSQSRRWLTRTLVSLAIFAATANAACVPLTGSTACPDFAKFQVDTSAKAPGGMGLDNISFSDLASFDKAVSGTIAFYTSESCTGYNRTQHIRYQNTVTCSVLVRASASCNSQSFPGMCADTCSSYASSLTSMITKVCPNDPESKRMATELSSKICTRGESFPYLASSDAACMSGAKNEGVFCGFESQATMCSFCAANATDACCTTNAPLCSPTTTATTLVPTSAPSSSVLPSPTRNTNQDTNDGDKKDGLIAGISTAALGGIIGGGVVVILLLFAFIVCCIRRKRGNKGGNKVHGSKGGANNLSRNVSTSSSTKYKISSPKLQEEGFSTGTVPSAPIPMTALPSLNQPATAAAITAGGAANRISKASSVGGAAADAGGKQYCQALYPYQASMADEMDLTPGDIVNVHKVFDDGWAVGVNMNTSNEGAFPVVCVMFVDEASLHDDFEDVNMHSMTPMNHREDDNNGRGSPRSSMPSRASSPVHLPRRQSSMIRDSVVIPGLNGRSSPLAGSPLAGGNQQGSKLQPPVRDTMMSDASSINRWWDGEGK
ncbi:hypothetical protein FBU30_010740 [Linnemannia zychae]|nr:hypothetical protein FBU30_010740 [Linnemannia zychae]